MTHHRTADEREQYRKNAGHDPGVEVYGFTLDRAPIREFTARFGVEWNDISTREDREHWIAGSSLKVIDLQTNEVIAERVGYMIDRGQGSQAGGRSPWLFAEQFACPSFPRIGQFDARQRRAGSETRRFVVRILNSASGE